MGTHHNVFPFYRGLFKAAGSRFEGKQAGTAGRKKLSN